MTYRHGDGALLGKIAGVGWEAELVDDWEALKQKYFTSGPFSVQ